MMRQLHIRNYALIDHLEIDWNNGFTVITGETGSGKSILLGALGLILGNRADISVLRNSQMKCVVEAVFDLSRFQLKPFFETNDLDYEELTTVRREIHHTGKSRAFINDTPVKLAQLKVLGTQLVDIHSQHETLNLKNNQFQLHLLDDFAGLSDEIKSYCENFKCWKNLEKQIADCREAIRLENQSRDFNTFQLEEIEVLNLKADEQDSAEQELEILGSAEEIKAGLHNASDAVRDGEKNAESLLRGAMQAMEPIRNKSTEFEELHQRIKSAWIELKDIGEELSRVAGEIEFNPERTAMLQERLDAIYKLEHKHGVQNISELLRIAEDLQEKLNSGADREHELQQMENAAAELRTTLGQQAVQLLDK
jgi:DNA repair protein RecN (Recombination protein N)